MKSIIGKKLGMTRIFDETGRDIPVTLIQAGPCTVSQVKTVEIDGYAAVQLAFGERKVKNISKPLLGHFKKAGITSAAVVREFPGDGADLELGAVITVDIFAKGDKVQVTGRTKGKGFTGVMKRHGFHGGHASHGKSNQLRAGGSIGASSDPSRVIPGMRMAGRSGNVIRTVRTFTVVKVFPESNQIMVSGPVPGARNGTIIVSKLS